MRNLVKVVTILLLFSLFAAPLTAEIKSVKIQSEYDDGNSILLDYFKFTHTGHISIAVSSMSLTSTSNNISSQPDPSRFGFYLLSDKAEEKLNFELTWLQRSISCMLDFQLISLLFTFKDLPNPLPSSFNKSYPVKYPNDYTLYFANCNPLSYLTMDVRTELYNIDNGNTKNYLSARITKLPRLFFVFSLIYLGFLALWIFCCSRNYKFLHWVDLLFCALLVAKAINLFCAAEGQHSVKVTGTRSHRWNLLFYISQFINRALLYTVIAVIFDGWSFMKPKAKICLVIVIPLQILATYQLSKLEGETDELVFMIVEIVLFVVILFMPVFISMATYETEEAACNDFAKFTLFWCVFILVGVYLFVNLMLRAAWNASDYGNWQSNAAEEIITLVFYIVMFLMFTPFEKHAYFVQVDEEVRV